MNIHPVITNGNKYCGPAVISSLLKIDTGEAARRIRSLPHIGDRPAVKGTYPWEIIAVLERSGLFTDQIFQAIGRIKAPTLAAWLRDSKDIRTAGRVFLVIAGNHWQLISGRRYVCGKTREIVSIRDKRIKRRARVTRVWEITRH